jgi:ElaA protein
MIFKVRSFEELTLRELYEILRVRTAVFVVEQNCPYQEVDGIDPESTHFFAEDDNGEIKAYLRFFPRKEEEKVMQIGRVLTTERGTGLGRKILHMSLGVIENDYDVDEIYLEAQTYAIGFYEKEGFRVVSDEFLEDGIPHVQMRRKTGVNK